MKINEIILLDKDDYTQESPQYLNFPKICRLCLRIDPEMTITVYCKMYSMSFKSLLDVYTLIKIPDEEDDLPQHLCSNCCRFLIEMHTFRCKCNFNETQLKMVLQNHLIKTNKAQNLLSSIHTYAKVYKPADNKQQQLDNSTNTLYKEEEINFEENSCNSQALYDPENDLNFKKMVFQVCEEKLGVYRCLDCPLTFPTSAMLGKHGTEAKHYLDKTVKCSQCEKFFTRTAMNRHMLVHSKEKKFQCSLCGLLLSSCASLNRHFKLHKGTKPFECDDCGREFAQKGTLKIHKKIHDNNKRKKRTFRDITYKTKLCLICRHGFPNQETFLKHMKENHEHEQVDCGDHTEENAEKEAILIDCNDKQIDCEDNLVVKHSKKLFICGMCYKTFSQFQYLANHMWVHGGEKHYKCPTCYKRFAHSGSLSLHMNIHYGVKQFTCLVCNQRFRQRIHLTRHMRLHNGERPYQCEVCGQTFAMKGNLTVHRRRHTGETPYVCRVCNRGFYDSSNRKKHERLQHSMKELEICSDNTKMVEESLRTEEEIHHDSNHFSSMENVIEVKQIEGQDNDDKHVKYLIVDDYDNIETIEWTVDARLNIARSPLGR